MGIIYCVQNKVNGKRYIGQSRNSLAKKKRAYIYAAFQRDPGYYSLLTKALREFGEDAFEWSVMFDNVDDEELNQLEIDTIAIYKTIVPDGYNSMTGGRRGSRHSDTTKKKLSEDKKGKFLSDEIKKKISETKKHPSDETRKKLSEAQLGKKASDETKKKMRDARKRYEIRRRTERSNQVEKEE